MYIITQTSLFDNEEIEILGDLERLKLAIENMPDEKIVRRLRKIRKNGRDEWPVEAMWNTFIASYVFNHRSVNDLLRELSRNSQLRQICGLKPKFFKQEDGRYKMHIVPSEAAYSRFLANLLKCKKEMKETFEELVEYMYNNLEGFGEDRMDRDGAVQTVYGFVVRQDCPICQLPEYMEQTRLFSPLTAEIYSRDDWGDISNESEEVSPAELCSYEDQIQKQILKEYMESEGDRGLAAYLDNQLLARKIRCMNPTVESWHGELWGVLEVQSYGSLSEKELEAVKEYWRGQESDGWGEGFEQRPIQTPEGELYVSFWNSGNDFFIATEEQLKGLEQESGMQMGGM